MKNNNGETLSILLIEDDPDDEALIIRRLRRANGWKIIYQCVSTEAALLVALDKSTWDIVLCDFKLPTLSPYKALELVKSIHYDLPLIIISGSVREDVAIELLKAGASDFISKDNPERLPLAIRRELRQAGDRVQSKLDIARSYDMTILGWSEVLELRDHFTSGHTQRVTDLTLRLARRMGIDGIDFINIYRGALLHDIGKMAIPDVILLKPEPLDLHEKRIIQKHPQIAYELLRKIPYLQGALNIPYCHHEKWDGSGYPQGLQGDAIPLEARIFAVVDVYDALTSDRPYRKAWSQDQALTYLQKQMGASFDSAIANQFLAMIGE